MRNIKIGASDEPHQRDGNQTVIDASANVRLSFGRRRSDKKIVHIDEVESGHACGCDCPACGRPLVAKHHPSGTRADHFAHYVNSDCVGVVDGPGGPETPLHRYAVRLIAEKKSLVVPAVVVEEFGGIWHGSPEGRKHYLNAEFETRYGPRKPDVTLCSSCEKLFVEVVVSHRCDEDKIAWIQDGKHPTVEIYLGEIQDEFLPKEKLDQIILESSPRAWLYSPEWKEGLDELRRKRDATVAHLARAEVAAFRDIENKAYGWPLDHTLVEICRKYGFADALKDESGRATGFFPLHPTTLKAKIIADYIIGRDGGFTADDVIRWLQKQRHLSERFLQQDADVVIEMEKMGVPANGHLRWIENFLRSIESICPLVAEGTGRWRLDEANAGPLLAEREARRLDEEERQRIWREEEARSRKEKKEIAQRIERERRYEEIRLRELRLRYRRAKIVLRHLATIVSAANLYEFDANTWIYTPQTRWGLSPLEIIQLNEELLWESFEKALIEISVGARTWTLVPSVLEGIPLEGAYRAQIKRIQDMGIKLDDENREQVVWLLCHPLAQYEPEWFFEAQEDLSGERPIDVAAFEKGGASRARIAATYWYYDPSRRRVSGKPRRPVALDSLLGD
jgi:hypothetical protein